MTCHAMPGTFVEAFGLHGNLVPYQTNLGERVNFLQACINKQDRAAMHLPRSFKHVVRQCICRNTCSNLFIHTYIFAYVCVYMYVYLYLYIHMYDIIHTSRF